MALKPVDMSDCSPKVRCGFGVNKGLAYDSTDPCPGGTEFNTHKCDCVDVANTWGVCATYADSCNGKETCRCQVFETGAAGLPTGIQNTSSSAGGCETGGWNISFNATFANGTTTAIPIASGVNSHKQQLVSYSNVYDQPTGGYDCEVPRAVGRIRITWLGGSNTVPDWNYNATPTVNVTNPPFYDAQGRFIDFSAGLQTAWGCSQSYLISGCCRSSMYDPVCPYATNVVASHDDYCFGGSGTIVSAYLIEYTDGVKTNWGVPHNFVSTIGGFCEAAFGTTWEVNVKWEQEVSPGVWVTI